MRQIPLVGIHSMNRRVSTVAFLAGAFVLGLAGMATASGSSVAAKEKAAKKACAMGDHEKGADILTDLFIATEDPVYIYNQARCYEQNNLWERAIARFKEYLRKAKHLTESERAATEKHIAECQVALDQPVRAEPSQASPGSVTSTTLAKSETTADTGTTTSPTTTVVTTPPSPPAPAGRGLRIAGIVSGVAGLAALGAGVGFALKTQSISAAEERDGPSREQEDEREKYEAAGWVCYGVGAAALATGVVLYLLGRSSDAPGTLTLIPSAHANGGGLLLAGGF